MALAKNRRFLSPRAVYVHVPFCRHRCGYCNFTLVANRDHLIDDYLRAIELELDSVHELREAAAGVVASKEMDSIYFGGGTPTHPAPAQIAKLLQFVTSRFRLVDGGEFTVEANPNDLTDEKLDLLNEFGVNRLSIGAQSFHPEKLRILERDHQREQIRDGAIRARKRGMAISLDLIFGTPEETAEIWRDDIANAASLAPEHISCYGLTIERGTTFFSRHQKKELIKPSEDDEAERYIDVIERLGSAGFEHYEVSNFARTGHRSRHNETYWLGRPYYAFGPGAARYVQGRREVNHRSTTTYVRRVLGGDSPIAESEFLSDEDSARERLVFALRRLDGVSISEFYNETGITVESLVDEPLAQFLDAGLLIRDGDRIKLSRSGLLVSDSIWPWFLDSSNRVP